MAKLATGKELKGSIPKSQDRLRTTRRCEYATDYYKVVYSEDKDYAILRVAHDLPRWEDLRGVDKTICDEILFELDDVIEVNVKGQKGGSKCNQRNT